MDTRQLQRAAQVVVSILSNLESFLLLTAGGATLATWSAKKEPRAGTTARPGF